MSERAAIYTRISKDSEEKGLGVARQEKDMRAIAKRRGARVVLSLQDNDLSASGKVTRPDYERLIDAITAGEVDVVLAYDLDRLNRGLTDYVRLYNACEKARIKVAWNGGQADFATGTGLFEMELRASFAREELRKLKQRTSRKHLELAENGHDAGGGRPFGFEDDRHTVRESEAVLIREAAKRALKGEHLQAICRDWQRRGIVSPWAGRVWRIKGEDRINAGRWSSQVLRRILVSARISGRRELKERNGNGSHGIVGEITATADWPAIIDAETSDRLRAMLLAPERRREAHPRKYLLTGGLLTCGVKHDDGTICGKPLHTVVARKKHGDRQAQRRSYGCIAGPGFSGGCGKLRINAEPLEVEVIEQVLDAADHGALVRVMKSRGKENGSATELLAVDAKLKELAREWAAGRITRGEWQAARGDLAARRDDLNKRVESHNRRLSLDGFESKTPLRDRWPTMTLDQQRAVIRLVLADSGVDHIVIKAATHRGPVFDKTRIGWEGLKRPS